MKCKNDYDFNVKRGEYPHLEINVFTTYERCPQWDFSEDDVIPNCIKLDSSLDESDILNIINDVKLMTKYTKPAFKNHQIKILGFEWHKSEKEVIHFSEDGTKY